MIRSDIKSDSRITQIFNDLDNYRLFCRDYGYRFNEQELYNHKSYVYRQYQRYITGKPEKNQWEIDAVRLNEQAVTKRR